MIFGTYTFTEVFGIPYEWAAMPRWYIIAGQVSESLLSLICIFQFYVFCTEENILSCFNFRRAALRLDLH